MALLKTNLLLEIYKPPRDNNNANNIYTFTTEIEPILQELSTANTEVLICGDYNINLLKLAGESHLADSLDMMVVHSFYPKITLPTRVNSSSGATLIDNIFISYRPIQYPQPQGSSSTNCRITAHILFLRKIYLQ